MDRKAFYEAEKSKLLKIAQNPFVKDKKTVDTRSVSFDSMWEEVAKEKFTGYIATATNEYRWHTLVIDGNIRFSVFFTKGVTLQGKEALLSLKSKWTNPPVGINKFYTTKEGVEAYYGMFSGLKIFDGVNADNIGIDRLFQKLQDEKFIGPAIFDAKNNKIIFLWHTGNILHIFPARNIALAVTEKDLEEVILSPIINITAIKAYPMSFNMPASKLLYGKRAAEFNAYLLCVQEKLRKIIGTRLMEIIGRDVKNILVKKHSFYESLIQFKGYSIVLEPKILDTGITRDFDEIIKEIIEIYVERAREDAGITLVSRAFAECKEKGEKKGEENS